MRKLKGGQIGATIWKGVVYDERLDNDTFGGVGSSAVGGRVDLWSSSRLPWHLMSISKKSSSGLTLESRDNWRERIIGPRFPPGAVDRLRG